MMKLISRRKLLKRGIRVSLTGMAVTSMARIAAAADKVCADPKQMDDGQTSMRKSLNYVEMSPDQSKTCSVCGFFQAGGDGCGTCMIFSGPVSPKGHCDSWSAKS
jgi:hypothetical protein